MTHEPVSLTNPKPTDYDIAREIMALRKIWHSLDDKERQSRLDRVVNLCVAFRIVNLGMMVPINEAIEKELFGNIKQSPMFGTIRNMILAELE